MVTLETLLATTAASLALAAPSPAPQRALAPPAQTAQSYLKIGDIAGEREHERAGGTEAQGAWIELSSLRWATTSADGEFWFEELVPGAHHDRDHERASGERAHRVVVKEVGKPGGMRPPEANREATAKRDLPAGTRLLVVDGRFARCALGTRHPALGVRHGDTAYRLEDVTIVACRKGARRGGAADDRPTEELAFYYDKIVYSYRAREHVLLGRQIP
ncbi:hypothetical protein [Sphingomicrobium astaxanthinifaciens]|uniref:hypothetical protein n=1 Tax=Sphingomicrobium astaxanthinifaciens TaxID=1227949 RepID=UPI001FCB59E1|nr:hypothetical protein [Sphingomicrobium astaxanthinifaciens]MCJ7421914.1 hypothetical protein [Sphingomicrobium astaxanthinifaciens]